MSKLISGKEALIALANGEEVQLQVLGDMNWHDSTQWTVGELLCFKGKFRLKPRTVNLNGVDVGQLYSSQWDKRNPKEVIIEFKTEDDALHFSKNALNIFNGG